MPTNPMNEVFQHLRRAALPRNGEGLTDGQLLENYLSHRDEAALADIVRRHGTMVWGVCRRVLRDYHEAEDAFQTTFLVLVRKASSIASRELLANWLYGVAHQTALKARATAAKRRSRESQVTDMPEPEAVQQDLWHDLQPLLDRELSRLPDKYRIPIVLCDLEGKTRKEAARQLGCPEGTIAGRLARARSMLAARLARRGIAMAGGALAAIPPLHMASASVPASIVTSTIKAASLYATGQVVIAGVISVEVITLTEAVLKAMLLTKLKIVSGILALIPLFAVADMVGNYSTRNESQTYNGRALSAVVFRNDLDENLRPDSIQQPDNIVSPKTAVQAPEDHKVPAGKRLPPGLAKKAANHPGRVAWLKAHG